VSRLCSLVEKRRSPKLNRPACAGLIAEDKAYLEYENDERELYDLGADPYQLENVYPGAEPTRKEGLATRLAALKGCAAETCRTAEDEPVL
jgi:hypothetical protein